MIRKVATDRHSESFISKRGMSALPPRATVEQTLLDVSKGPQPGSCTTQQSSALVK